MVIRTATAADRNPLRGLNDKKQPPQQTIINSKNHDVRLVKAQDVTDNAGILQKTPISKIDITDNVNKLTAMMSRRPNRRTTAFT